VKKFIHKKILLLFFILYVNSILITTAQDKIYTLQGKTILCAILKETKTSVFYNVNNVPKLYSIDFSEIDIIRYNNGKILNIANYNSDYNYVLTSINKQNKFNNNSTEFMSYANSLASEMTQTILGKIPGKIDNSSYQIYTDLVHQDSITLNITIPIKITYEKYLSINNGYIIGQIIIKPDGTKQWFFKKQGTY
jgi:hypothetical protein